MPDIVVGHVPTPTHPGWAGARAGRHRRRAGAVVNAINDALAPFSPVTAWPFTLSVLKALGRSRYRDGDSARLTI
jgi:hypothetical protein